MGRYTRKLLFCLVPVCLSVLAAAVWSQADTAPFEMSVPSFVPSRSCQNLEAGRSGANLPSVFTLGPLACLQDRNSKAYEEPGPVVPVVVNRKVEWFINHFQTEGKWYFAKWLGRTGGYDNLIKGILREEGLPEDLFYVALIESGLSPTARSRSNAVGMWQFIKPTATRYGLRVDRWIDERRDPEKSTMAAARFLKHLYGRFGSWHLAMAGYNAGEGRVRRAVRRYGSSDYWVLSKYRRGAFRRETRSYVPKYLAAMMIAKDPLKYGFDRLEYADSVSYEKVALPGATDLRIIAKAAGVGVKELKRLNPELLNWFTPPDYPGYEIKLPEGTAAAFRENFAKIPELERLEFLLHRLKPGETVYGLAIRYGTRVSQILYFNNVKNPRRIRAGRTIIIPVRAGKGKKKT